MWTYDFINHMVVELKMVIALATTKFLITTNLYELHPMNERDFHDFIKQQWCMLLMKGAPLGLVCNFLHPWWTTSHNCGFRTALCMVFSVTRPIVSWLLYPLLGLEAYVYSITEKINFHSVYSQRWKENQTKKECRNCIGGSLEFSMKNHYDAITLYSCLSNVYIFMWIMVFR